MLRTCSTARLVRARGLSFVVNGASGRAEVVVALVPRLTALAWLLLHTRARSRWPARSRTTLTLTRTALTVTHLVLRSGARLRRAALLLLDEFLGSQAGRQLVHVAAVVAVNTAAGRTVKVHAQRVARAGARAQLAHVVREGAVRVGAGGAADEQFPAERRFVEVREDLDLVCLCYME